MILRKEEKKVLKKLHKNLISMKAK